MKRFKTKCATIAVAVGCLFACLGFGVFAMAQPSQANVTADAETTYTTYTVNTIGATGAGSGTFYASVLSGDALTINSWDHAFTLEAGTGEGFALNGEPFTVAEVKQPDTDFYIVLGKEVKTGDVLTINGTYSNATLAAKIVFKNCRLTFNGTAWEVLENIGELTLHGNSNPNGAAGKLSNNLYLKRADDGVLPVLSWAYLFEKESDACFKINGENASMPEMKSTGDGLFVNLGRELSANEYVTIGGTFYCAARNVRYTIAESAFRWTGSQWEKFIIYNEYTATAVGATGSSDASTVYIYPVGGQFPNGNDPTWSKFYTFEQGSGTGLTLAGVTLSTTDIKLPGTDFFVALGATAKVGDVLAIDGSYYNDSTKIKITFDNCGLKWNGSAWESYTLYNEYTATAIGATGSSDASTVYIYPVGGQFPNGNDPSWKNIYTFEAGSGTGLTLAGVTLSTTDIKLPGTDFFVALGATAKEGDVLTIDGSYYNDSAKIKITFDNCGLKWNGSAWESYTLYNEYTATAVAAAAGSTATALYIYPQAGVDAFPHGGGDWDSKYTFEQGSGTGLTLAGVALSTTDIKLPGTDLYINLEKTGNVGDILTIDGAYYNNSKKIKLIFDNCSLQWNGSAWETYNPVEEPELPEGLTNYDIGALEFQQMKPDALNMAFFIRKDHLAIPQPTDLETLWNTWFSYAPGAITVNGKNVTVGVKFPNAAFLEFSSAPTLNDVLIIGGDFYNTDLNVTYTITTSAFVWNGNAWVDYTMYNVYSLGVLAGESSATAVTLNPVEGTLGVDSWDIAFTLLSGSCTWNGVAYTTGDIKQPGSNMYVALNKTAKAGDIFTISGSFVNHENKILINLPYLAIQYDGAKWGTYKGHAVTYTTSAGTVVGYAKPGEQYTLAQGKTFNTFIAWKGEDGKIYKAGDKITVSSAMSFTALELEFTMQKGAAVRVTTDVATSGIRFTSNINQAQLEALKGYGIEIVGYGTLILPYDYLGAGQAPNLAKFTPGTDIVQIPSTKYEVVDGYIVFRGAMQNLNEGNYDRLFAGCAYIQVKINGKVVTFYTDFDKKDNVRSIIGVARAFMADDSEPQNNELRYNNLSETCKGVVQTYAADGEIKLLDYELYKENGIFDVVAWNFPKLDPTNNYDNEGNRTIVAKMKATGIKVVNLTGANHGDYLMNTEAGIEKTRKLIHFFWSQGLKTIAFMGVNADKINSMAVDFTQTGTPDFSDCPGFIGFLHWDEPSYNNANITNKLAALATQFDTMYAGTGVAYINNLYPSYATDLTNVNTYKKYVDDYCKNVLSQVDGEKWLSVDTYPVYENGSLESSFLFDLGVIKTYSLQYGAKSHVALQSSGFSGKTRIPTEDEMRMQAYAALAFGFDSISWFSYSPSASSSETFYTFVDNNGNVTDKTAYTAFSNVNNELATIAPIYSAFDWKGIILGIGNSSTSKNLDYDAYNRVKDQLSVGGKNYELTASGTKLISSISKSGDFNYLMGVMEDKNGNEGYVLCNYNCFMEKDNWFSSVKNPKDVDLTLNFKTINGKTVKEVIIYNKGEATTQTVENGTLQINLKHAEGLIVLPSKLG